MAKHGRSIPSVAPRKAATGKVSTRTRADSVTTVYTRALRIEGEASYAIWPEEALMRLTPPHLPSDDMPGDPYPYLRHER